MEGGPPWPGQALTSGTAGCQRIGVCWDGSAEAELALQAAIDLARTTGAELLALTAIDRPAESFPTYPAPDVPDYMVGDDLAEDLLAAAMEHIPEGIRAEGQTIHGTPAMALSRQAKATELDLLVSGSRGYGPLGRVLLGGVSSKLMRMAPCPVIVVPRSVSAEGLETAPSLTSTAANP